MKIKRYFFPMSADVPDDPNGDWVKYEDVKLLLERIKELEAAVDGVKKLRDEWYVRDLTQSDFDTIIAELTGGKG